MVLRSKVDVFIQLHRNATELKAVNGALELTSAELRRRVADLQSVNQTLSHDLRAPLRSIDGFSRILSESYRGKLDEEADRYLLRIANACARMSRMLDDLYRLLRIGGADQSFVSVDSHVVLEGVIEDLRADIQATGAVVSAGPMPTVPANPTLLALILQNLIANAIKFRGAEAPQIHVSVERESAGWRFSIKDNGIGIETQFAGKVFGLFQRLTNDTVPGTGVGLALCKQSVEKHGGAIWVESEAGRGCTFYFTIPAAQPDSQTRRSESS
jgi:light-regulated signal transduction histidine kinase (bacteriophytochrome)